MFDSSTRTTTKTDAQRSGAGKHKVVPIPAERYTQPAAGYRNGSSNGRLDDAVPESAGARIPVRIRTASSAVADAAVEGGDNRQMDALSGLPGAMAAAIPDVMAAELEAQLAEVAETVEGRVGRLRPKTLGMQWRFLRTLLFAFLLFGRLIFWQVYVAKLFPSWVNKNNAKRWQKYAREFRQFAIRLGGVHIKAGQFASTRADILPEAVLAELAGLQDKVPTLPFSRIQQVLRAELANVEERFESIDEIPIAAASLGQVHRAKLKTGERVVIKVQRPNVRDIVYTDMAALFIVAHVAMRFQFIRRRSDSVLIVEEFGRVLLEEISYLKEAENARRFQAMFADDSGVYVPGVYDEHTTDCVLTMEDVTAIKIDDYQRLAAAGINRKDVAKRLNDTYMKQIFEDRFFHADPHPGNLFVYPLPVEDENQYVGNGGRPFYLIFVDFGMTATLTREIVQGLVNTLTAVLRRDARKLVQSYQELSFLLPNADTRRIEEATALVFDEVWGMNMTEIRDMDFAVMEDIGKAFNDLLYDMPFRVPQDFVYLGRTIGILTGMTTKLDPEFNPWTEIQYYVQKLIATDEAHNIFDELGKIIEESFSEIVANGPQGLIAVTERVLRQFQRVNRSEKMLQQLIDGEVAVNTRMSPQQRRQLERIELQGKRSARMLLVGSLLICATLLYINGDINFALAGYGLSALLFLSVLFIRQ